MGTTYVHTDGNAKPLSPPYLSSSAEITTRNLGGGSQGDCGKCSQGEEGEKLGFLILGSYSRKSPIYTHECSTTADNVVFRRLTSEEAVLLTAGFTRKADLHVKLNAAEKESLVVSKKRLSKLISVKTPNNCPWPVEALPGTKARTKQSCTDKWSLKSENASSHLLSNAFGGGDEMMHRRWKAMNGLVGDATAV